MYPGFADIAEEEDLIDISERLFAIGYAETHHEERYRKFLERIEAGTLFKKDKEVEWNCRKCGYVYIGTEPPKKCPSCDHPSSYFEIKCEEY